MRKLENSLSDNNHFAKRRESAGQQILRHFLLLVFIGLACLFYILNPKGFLCLWFNIDSIDCIDPRNHSAIRISIRTDDGKF